MPFGLPRRGARTENLSTGSDATVGKYTYTPGTAYSAIDARGTLRGDGVRVENRVTESLLSEFLTLLDAAQAELNQRWSGQRNSGCHTDRR
ncbi:hypothetical protein SALBM311S_04128 [Streptomyces alboniger]